MAVFLPWRLGNSNTSRMFFWHLLSWVWVSRFEGLHSLLPPANEVCDKVVFSQASLILTTGEGGVLHLVGVSIWGVCIQGSCIQGGLHPGRVYIQGGSASRGVGYWNSFFLMTFDILLSEPQFWLTFI